jgi:hypothetical protein
LPTLTYVTEGFDTFLMRKDPISEENLQLFSTEYLVAWKESQSKSDNLHSYKVIVKNMEMEEITYV